MYGPSGNASREKAGVIAALISAAVCAAAQLAVSLAFTYTELGDLFMPLFRINNLKSLETHLLRMDKLAHIAWLTGGMLTGSFYIYSASLLFSQVFGVRDIRPVLSSNVLLVGLLIIIDLKESCAFFPTLAQRMPSTASSSLPCRPRLRLSSEPFRRKTEKTFLNFTLA